MLEIKSTTRFRKDYKRIKKQGKDIAKLREVLNVSMSPVIPAICRIFYITRPSMGWTV